MVKVVLVNAPYIDLYGPIKMASGQYFPLGLGYIAAVLRKAGHRVQLLDPEVQQLDQTDLRKALSKEGPDAVGITCATPNFAHAVDIAKLVKQETDAITIIGGVHASALPEAVLQSYPQVDIAVVGEGENTMLELLDTLSVRGSLSEVKGIVYRDGPEIHWNKRRPWIKDLDSLPFPARDLVDINLYRPHSHNVRRKPCITMLTSRGCPFGCNFCASHLSLGRGFRAHSPEYVIEEIEYLVKEYGAQQLLITDDTFTVDKSRVVKICNGIIRKAIKVEWFCFARVDLVDRELLSLMKRAGCFSIGYGVESGDQRILENLSKGIDLVKCKEIFQISNELGFKTQAFFILGSVGETQETIKKTIRFSLELDPVLAFFNILVPYPGTKVFNEFCDADQIDNWEDFVAVGINPAIELGSLTRRELRKAIYEANRRFYLRPGQLLKMLSGIRSTYELSQYLRGGIGLLRQMRRWHKNSSRASRANRFCFD